VKDRTATEGLAQPDKRKEIVNRVISLGAIVAHPRNYQQHPESQIAELMASLRRFRQVRNLVVQEQDGGYLMVAGHGVMEAARRLEWEELRADVLPATWTAEQVMAYLVADNELAKQAEPDEVQLATLLKELEDSEFGLEGLGWHEDELEALIEELGMDEEPPEDPGAQLDMVEELREKTSDLPLDILWQTDNEWGIPLLNINLAAEQAVLPLKKWGTVARTKSARKMPGTWYFYTDDYKFSGLWRDPTPIVNSGCTNVIEPNFSTTAQMPRAVALWRIYQKRWLARYWQSRGIRVFVDLCVDPLFYDLNLLGVPFGWKAWATRVYADQLNMAEHEFEMACARPCSVDRHKP